MTEIYHITGPPGTGKTSHLAQRAAQAADKRGSHRIAALSLTRAAAREIGSRGLDIPEGQLGTLHSFCFQAAGSPVIADRKIDEWNEAYPQLKLPIPHYDETKIDEDLSNMNLSADYDERAENCRDAMNLFRHQLIPYEAWPLYVKGFAKKWDDWKRENKYMDFTDLITFGLEEMEYAPGVPEVLIVDECQDMSRLEIKVIHKWGEGTDILLEAGDPDQAIYTWRGANPKVFMENEIPQANKKYLRRTWRLPKTVHKFIRKWIRDIKDREDVEFEPRDAEGEVIHSEASYSEPDEMIDICKEQIVNGKSTMILASCGYMLNQIVNALKVEGLPFYNPFSTKNAKWNPLQKIRDRVMPVDKVEAFLRPHESSQDEQREWTCDDFRKWMGVLQSKDILKRGIKTYIQSEALKLPKDFAEFSDWFLNKEDAVRANSLDLDWFLSSVIKSRKPPLIYPARIAKNQGAAALGLTPIIIVGTIHSVKGGQADTVIIFPDLSMSGWNHNETKVGHDDVRRVFYVGLTRARERLILCNPCSTRAVSW